ncbi:hypothetical protein K2W90_03160 [Candidatus Babeliales bacterium]|nr:hypothetical protein [Candidatus Babeliales bacterium]
MVQRKYLFLFTLVAVLGIAWKPLQAAALLRNMLQRSGAQQRSAMRAKEQSAETTEGISAFKKPTTTQKPKTADEELAQRLGAPHGAPGPGTLSQPFMPTPPGLGHPPTPTTGIGPKPPVASIGTPPPTATAQPPTTARTGIAGRAQSMFEGVQTRLEATQKTMRDTKALSSTGPYQLGTKTAQDLAAGKTTSPYGAKPGTSVYAPGASGSPYQGGTSAYTGTKPSTYVGKPTSSAYAPAPSADGHVQPVMRTRDIKAQAAAQKEQEDLAKRLQSFQQSQAPDGSKKVSQEHAARAKAMGLSLKDYETELAQGTLTKARRQELRDAKDDSRGMIYNMTVGAFKRDVRQMKGTLQNPLETAKSEWKQSLEQLKKTPAQHWKESMQQFRADKATLRTDVTSFVETFKQSGFAKSLLNAKDQADIKAKELELKARYYKQPDGPAKVKAELDVYKQQVADKRAVLTTENKSIVQKRQEVKQDLTNQAQAHYNEVANRVAKTQEYLVALGKPQAGEPFFRTQQRKTLEKELAADQKLLPTLHPQSPLVTAQIAKHEEAVMKNFSKQLQSGRPDVLQTSKEIKQLLAEQATATPERKTAIQQQLQAKIKTFEDLTNPQVPIPTLVPPAKPAALPTPVRPEPVEGPTPVKFDSSNPLGHLSDPEQRKFGPTASVKPTPPPLPTPPTAGVATYPTSALTLGTPGTVTGRMQTPTGQYIEVTRRETPRVGRPLTPEEITQKAQEINALQAEVRALNARARQAKGQEALDLVEQARQKNAQSRKLISELPSTPAQTER